LTSTYTRLYSANHPRFMDSLQWVDQTYIQKHKDANPDNLREMYYPNLRRYATRDGSTHSRSTAEALTMLFIRLGRKAGISLAIFALSYMPVVGRLVLPAASFYTFNKAVGLGPAAIIFGTGIALPRKYLIIFLQSYFTSRSLMRELVCLLLSHFELVTNVNFQSLNRIFQGFDLRKNKKRIGFMIEKDCFSDSPSDFTYS
jgi:hypothetical protein